MKNMDLTDIKILVNHKRNRLVKRRFQTVDKVHGSCRGFFFATEIRGYASAIERRRQAPDNA